MQREHTKARYTATGPSRSQAAAPGRARACPPLRPAARDSILMLMLLVLRVEPSMTLRHSAVTAYLPGCDFRKTYTWLLAMRSCAISTFSLPLTTK